MNRTGKTNASKGVENHYNEYKEFHLCETEAHICASFMEMCGMLNMEDHPTFDVPDDSVTREIQRKWLMETCAKFVDKYVMQVDVNTLVQKIEKFDEQNREIEVNRSLGFVCRVPGCKVKYISHSNRVKHEVTAHKIIKQVYEESGMERDEFGYYYCRWGCGLVYSTSSIRNRHEIGKHSQVFDPDSTHSIEINESQEEDNLYNYHCAKLTFGLLLMEFNDGIKEGDGERLIDVYKVALLLFKEHGKTKYAYEVLLLLVKINGILSKYDAHNLKWNRFFNKHGIKGGNIPLDLRMEQLNKIVKTLWRSLGANLNEASAARLANTVDEMEAILDEIDQDCDLASNIGYRSKGKPEVAVAQVTKDLVKINASNFAKAEKVTQHLQTSQKHFLED
ncbi:uncharacterized protein LOC114530810 [Dendronephthya gigantea]|uniref:uncharacterized protein LOC114530810 n=1 Tax=Dendronephthya gigantea TaxID=151771 RepID=UPI00106C014F|nr:uncharacterized protein LOC114530810 [Dendronephthya gigantea]